LGDKTWSAQPVQIWDIAMRRTVATMDTNGVIRLWDACTDCENSNALMVLAKTRVTRQLTPIEKRTYLGG
jgi:hypothetical protein